MAKTYKQPGEVMDYTNTSGSTITAGTIVLVGLIVGVVLADIPNNATGELSVCGVHTLPKAAVNGGQGDQLYFDETNHVITNTSSSGANKAAGKAFAAYVNGDATISIKLNV